MGERASGVVDGNCTRPWSLIGLWGAVDKPQFNGSLSYRGIAR
jgi:hypothetical protein